MSTDFYYWRPHISKLHSIVPRDVPRKRFEVKRGRGFSGYYFSIRFGNNLYTISLDKRRNDNAYFLHKWKLEHEGDEYPYGIPKDKHARFVNNWAKGNYEN